VDQLYEIITFDCYGTLIDWERGIRDAFAAAAAASGRPVDAAAAARLFAETEPVVEAETFRSYRDVLAETGRRVAVRLGWPLPAARAGFLAESMLGWTPFPDTNVSLRRLAGAGYRLGILSNVDDDLLAWTRRHFAAPFDLIVTAEQVRSYKPAPGHFLTARARIGGRPWLHAAQSYFHDVTPCRALGIPCAWINRKSQAPGGAARPDREFRTLAELADWLAPVPAHA
jgi:2-haloacid dehalogenase/putative hydrolase of the HAD superfamily